MIPSSKLLGRSSAAFEMARAIVKAAPTDASVLIIGESGTGKEVIARTVHRRSQREHAPFVAINCGAISPSLAESELFGHEKGAFTGAVSRSTGCFERAHTGTLFLDEVTEMPASIQVQLLRVLETGTFYRVGGSEPISVDVRIIAATNRDLQETVNGGTLRSDLLYRLAVFPIKVPPLRERKSDIAYLAQKFLDELNAQEGGGKVFSATSMPRLQEYNWPGNIRELKNTIIRAYILADDKLVDIAPMRPFFRDSTPTRHLNMLRIPVGTSLAAAERSIILATLDHYDGDRRRSALALGISPKTLHNRLERLKRNQSPPVPEAEAEKPEPIEAVG
ncbi:sigma-54-dependent Fis family transcriptional regulator [Alcaligenaceae bacterium]|nr:sigma-54-dependent Fis family transcriptional regulator [Alcaligenaceae bacterium]